MPATPFDLVIRGGTVGTATGAYAADVAIAGGKVVAVGQGLGTGTREIDATGRLVLPGGIDSHTHIEQVSAGGLLNADTFESATTSAAFGGNTTVISFAAQHRGKDLRKVVDDYSALAARGALIDYAFHLIVANPDEKTVRQDLPELIGEGHASIKIFMTYDLIKVDDDIHVNFDNLYAVLPDLADYPYVGRRTPTRPGITPSSNWHFGKVAPGSLHEGLPHKVEGPPEFWAGGGMYVVRRDAAAHLATTLAHQVAHYHLYEDFMVGDLLARHGVQAQPWDELPVANGQDWCITNLRDIMSEDLSSLRDEARMKRAISVHCGPYPPYYRIDDGQMRELFRSFDAR